jgi:hypothetical protein
MVVITLVREASLLPTECMVHAVCGNGRAVLEVLETGVIIQEFTDLTSLLSFGRTFLDGYARVWYEIFQEM